MSQFTLRPDALEWQIGRRSGRVRYDRVRAIRLSYRPVTMQSHRFITEIWSADNPKIQIVSVSWRSIVEQERLDEAYSAFIAELHRRLAAAGAHGAFTTGLPVATYWVGVVMFAAVMIATAGLWARALIGRAMERDRDRRRVLCWCSPISSASISTATGRAAIAPTRSRPACCRAPELIRRRARANPA